jgi:hypothetical protein
MVISERYFLIGRHARYNNVIRLHIWCLTYWLISLSTEARRKETLGRPRRRWVDNIKMDLREVGWDGMDWIELVQDRDQWRALVKTVMNLRVP